MSKHSPLLFMAFASLQLALILGGVVDSFAQAVADEEQAPNVAAINQNLSSGDKNKILITLGVIARLDPLPEELIPNMAALMISSEPEIALKVWGMVEFNSIDTQKKAALIQSALKSPSRKVRIKAAQYIGQAGSPTTATLKALIETSEDQDDEVRAVVLYSLSELIEQEIFSIDDELVENLIDTAERASRDTGVVKIDGIETKIAPASYYAPILLNTLAKRSERAKTMQSLYEDLSDSKSRIASLNALDRSALQTTEGIELVVRLLRDDSKEVQRSALYKIGDAGIFGVDAVPLLDEFKKSADLQIRIAALRALALIKRDPKAEIAELIALTKSQDPDLRMTLALALANIFFDLHNNALRYQEEILRTIEIAPEQIRPQVINSIRNGLVFAGQSLEPIYQLSKTKGTAATIQQALKEASAGPTLPMISGQAIHPLRRAKIPTDLLSSDSQTRVNALLDIASTGSRHEWNSPLKDYHEHDFARSKLELLADAMVTTLLAEDAHEPFRKLLALFVTINNEDYRQVRNKIWPLLIRKGLDGCGYIPELIELLSSGTESLAYEASSVIVTLYRCPTAPNLLLQKLESPDLGNSRRFLIDKTLKRIWS